MGLCLSWWHHCLGQSFLVLYVCQFMSYVKRMNDPWQDTLEFASLSAWDEYGRGVMEHKSICICETIKNGVMGLDMRWHNRVVHGCMNTIVIVWRAIDICHWQKVILWILWNVYAMWKHGDLCGLKYVAGTEVRMRRTSSHFW
jgi:hypothetical protein